MQNVRLGPLLLKNLTQYSPCCLELHDDFRQRETLISYMPLSVKSQRGVFMTSGR